MPEGDIRIIATDLGFPEGPVWMADGSVILGEISGKKVTRVAPDGSEDRDRQGRRRAERRRDRPGRRALCLQQRRRGLRDDAELSVDRAGAGLQARLDPAHRPQDRRNQDALHRVQRPQTVGAERHRVRQAGRVLFHRSRQALRASPRQWRALLRAAGRLEDRRTRLSAAHPERGRPVAGRKDRLCRRHRKLAALRVRHRRAGRRQEGAFPGAVRRPSASAACRAFSASTASRSRPPAISASRRWSPAISR